MRAILFRVLVVVAALAGGDVGLSAAPAPAEPTAPQRIARLEQTFAGAKTIQANLHVTVTQGKLGAQTTGYWEVTVKSIPGRKHSILLKPLGATTASGQKVPQTETVMVDDGKRAITYYPTEKRYRSGPSQRAQSFLQLLRRLLRLGEADLSYSLVESAAGSRESSVTIRGVPNKPLPRMQYPRLLFVLDKQTNRLEMLSLSAVTVGPDGQPSELRLAMDIDNLELNVPLTDADFKVTLAGDIKQERAAPVATDFLPGAFSLEAGP